MSTLLSTIRRDWMSNRGNNKGRVVAVLFRIAHAIATRNGRSLIRWLGRPYLLLYHVAGGWILGVEICEAAQIGTGMRVYHGQALVIGPGAIIGKNCILRQSTTIGSVHRSDGQEDSSPCIGDDVDIGAHACIIGNVRVGDGVRIGAGAVVVNDIPSNSVAVGNPARVIANTVTVS
jgi:putative colanic acid biosynthesis acetyltransferase WcaB